jgi:HAMP domain-containing protein/type II secretory pathway pseudopilin PulG
MRARTQLTVAVTAVVALLVAIIGQFLVWRTGQRDRDDIDQALATRAAQISSEAAKTGKLPTDGAYPVRLISGTQVRAQSGSTVQFSTPVTDGFSTVAAADGHDYRSWAETLKTGVQLQVLTGYSAAEGRHRQAVRLVDLSVLAAILVGGLAGWFATGIVLRPLRRLEEGARELSPDDLSGRLPGVKEPREVAEIAASVNALLDRMQAAAESEPAAPPPSARPTPPDRPALSAEPAPDPVGAVAGPPDLPEPTTSTVTPPPAEPDTFPPRPAPVEAMPGEVRAGEVRAGEVRAGEVRAGEVRAGEVRAVAPTVAGAAGGELRGALEKLGDDLDTLLDNPELSTTQRHLILASIQNEYRRIVLLTQDE